MQGIEALKGLSAKERKELLKQLQQEEKEDQRNRREAYETLRHQFAFDVESKLMPIVNNVQGFYEWIVGESEAFRNVMRDYGRLRRGEEQSSFSVVDEDFKLEVKSNKVKSFDERADLAAERLINYLKNYVGRTDKGVDDPMYHRVISTISPSVSSMSWRAVLMRNMLKLCSYSKRVTSSTRQLPTITFISAI